MHRQVQLATVTQYPRFSEIELSHDDDAERPEQGPEARSRHHADHSTEDADAPPAAENVGAGDDPVSATNDAVDQRQVVADVEDIIEGEAEDDGDVLEAVLAPPRRRGHTITTTTTEWKAPLPPPAALREYEDICPGSADRVLRMAERQIDLREARDATVRIAIQGEVSVQSTLAEGDRDALRRGQYLAAAVSALVAALSFAGMFLTPWAALGFAVPLAQVATSLIRTISDGHNHDKAVDPQA